MTSSAAAGRYARALFDVVLKEQPGDLDAVQTQVTDLAALFAGNAAMAAVMGNPAIPVTKKIAVVQAVLARAGAIAGAGGEDDPHAGRARSADAPAGDRPHLSASG